VHDVSLDSPLADPPHGGSRTEALRASPPMFRWPWLDRLTRVHPMVPPLIFVPVIAVLVVSSAPQSGIGARLHWMVHGVHHDHPNDPLRLVMPPAVSVPLAALFLGLFVLVVGTPLAWAVGAGFLAGYLFYDMLHYALHHHLHARNTLERRLRELHMRHHFEDDSHGYGISAPWWDLIFGTLERRGRGPQH